MDKQELKENLLSLIKKAHSCIDIYEEYLLDQKDWRALATEMKTLRDIVEKIETEL